MKKSLKLITALLFAGVAVANVNAEDLNLTTDDTSLKDVTSFKESYDKENDVNLLEVTLTLNKELIDGVLAQAPGNANSAASLGTFYFGINPGLDKAGLTFKKNRIMYTGDVADYLEELNKAIEGEDAVTYSTVWNKNISIQYKEGNEWKNVETESKGGKTIGENLAELLNVKEEELQYGVNFRFYLNEEQSTLWGWEVLGEEALRHEYVSISYKVNFPIAAVDGGDKIFYPTLEEALTSGSSKVEINENVTIDGDLEVPEGVTLTVKEEVTLEVNGELTINGSVNNEGTLIVDETKVYTLVVETENGTVTTDVTTSAAGELVTVNATPLEGYKLKSLKVFDAEGKEVTVTDGKFEMPESNVTVVAEFEKVATEVEVEPPKTFDGILSSFVVLVLGVLGLSGLAIYRKKQTN